MRGGASTLRTHRETRQVDIVLLQMGVIGEKLVIDFVISTGDKFYENGLTGVEDPAFHEYFTDIYTAPSLQKQTMVHRGNVVAQLIPILRKMDGRWLCLRSFILNAGPDATPFVSNYFTNPEEHEVESGLRESTAKWKIVVGHHKIKSAGQHGNTHEFDLHLLPLLQAYDVDLYINGHDHCLQHISSIESGIQFMTSEGDSRAWRGDDGTWNNPQEMKLYHDGQGFMSLKMTQTELDIKFYDVFL
ncbi:Purple acid phosphatase 3 [Hibiscus syriacus]|uniref:Purple acid phosphatase 3 n=1 Tax=Hibiscus syriacus TaxID=106335 RepID=A0A6A2ZH35_HIBSY|nr:Purple acid phosphatase 3 [Hibiscus syriacus]